MDSRYPEAQTGQTASMQLDPMLSAVAPPRSLYYGYYGPLEVSSPLDRLVPILDHWLLLVLYLVAGLMVAEWHTSRQTPAFQSWSTVNIGTYLPAIDSPISSLLRTETQKQDYVQTQVAMLTSITLAQRVLARHADIREFMLSGVVKPPSASDKEAGATDPSVAEVPIQAVFNYLGCITANRLPNTSLVTTVVTTSSSDMSARIANVHATEFIDYVRYERLRIANINLDFLKKRAAEISLQAQEADRKVIDYARANSVELQTGAEGQMSTAFERYRGLIGQLSNAIEDRAALSGQLRELRLSNTGGRVYDSPAATGFQLQMSQVQAEYDLYKKNYPNLPQTELLRRQLKAMQTALKESANAQARDIEVRLRSAEQREKVLRDEYAKVQKEQVDQAKAKVEYELLVRERDATRASAENVLKRLEDASLNASNDQQNVTLVDPALPNSSPLYPRPMNNRLAGLCTSFLLAITTIFLLEMQKNAITSLAEVRRIVRAPILGVVPAFSRNSRLRLRQLASLRWEGLRGNNSSDSSASQPGLSAGSPTASHSMDEANPQSSLSVVMDPFSGILDSATRVMQAATMIQSPPTGVVHAQNLPANGDKTTVIARGPSVLLLSSPHSRESETFRSIRATIRYSAAQQAPKIILVTSAQKGDGKTTVATNLAVALAQSSLRTLLIDADLRIPSVHTYFEKPRNTLGLVDYLTGQRDFAEVILEGGVSNLDILLAGSPTPIPAELVGTRQMLELVELLGTEYEQIIIDSPPVSHVSDTLLLARLVDGVTIVVRNGYTSRPMLEFAVNRLRQINANILGTIVNDVKRNSSYRDYSGYYTASGNISA